MEAIVLGLSGLIVSLLWIHVRRLFCVRVAAAERSKIFRRFSVPAKGHRLRRLGRLLRYRCSLRGCYYTTRLRAQNDMFETIRVGCRPQQHIVVAGSVQ